MTFELKTVKCHVETVEEKISNFHLGPSKTSPTFWYIQVIKKEGQNCKEIQELKIITVDKCYIKHYFSDSLRSDRWTENSKMSRDNLTLYSKMSHENRALYETVSLIF